MPQQVMAHATMEAGEADGVELEQLDAEADGTRVNEPFDPSGIRITTGEPTVREIVERMRRGEIDAQPDAPAAGNGWPQSSKSRLIESLLLRVPLPVFYVAADVNGHWRVVDGMQRLGAVKDFVLTNKLALRGLEYFVQFEGSRYDDLPRPMQRRIGSTRLSCHVIEPGTPGEVMFNLFKRVSAEGRPLSGQEIRHALNPGPARALLRELAESAEFIRATHGRVSPRRMADRECVLRFLAFRSMGLRDYPGKLDAFLMKAMGFLNRDRRQHSELAADFRRAMALAADIFGPEAFRKPRGPVNKPLFESLSVALAGVPEPDAELLRSRGRKLVEGLAELMNDAEFLESISVATQTRRQVGIRFGRTSELVREVLS